MHVTLIAQIFDNYSIFHNYGMLKVLYSAFNSGLPTRSAQSSPKRKIIMESEEEILNCEI